MAQNVIFLLVIWPRILGHILIPGPQISSGIQPNYFLNSRTTFFFFFNIIFLKKKLVKRPLELFALNK